MTAGDPRPVRPVAVCDVRPVAVCDVRPVAVCDVRSRSAGTERLTQWSVGR